MPKCFVESVSLPFGVLFSVITSTATWAHTAQDGIAHLNCFVIMMTIKIDSEVVFRHPVLDQSDYTISCIPSHHYYIC